MFRVEDGLKIAIEQSDDTVMQSMFSNVQKQDRSLVLFIFETNGKINSQAINPTG